MKGIRKAGVVDFLSMYSPCNKTVFTVKCQMAKEDTMTETLKKSAFITLDADEGASEQTLAWLDAQDAREEEKYLIKLILCMLAIFAPMIVVAISNLVSASY